MLCFAKTPYYQYPTVKHLKHFKAEYKKGMQIYFVTFMSSNDDCR